MVTPEKLLIMLDESANVPQLEELHSVIAELAWRRKEQETLERVVKDVRDTMSTMSAYHMLLTEVPSFWQWCRIKLARIRQAWAL